MQKLSFQTQYEELNRRDAILREQMIAYISPHIDREGELDFLRPLRIWINNREEFITHCVKTPEGYVGRDEWGDDYNFSALRTEDLLQIIDNIEEYGK